MRFSYSKRKTAKLFANSGDPDQTPHSAASDLGLHFLPITLLGVSRLQRFKYIKPLLRRDLLLSKKNLLQGSNGSKFVPLKIDTVSEGRQNNCVSLHSISFPVYANVGICDGLLSTALSCCCFVGSIVYNRAKVYKRKNFLMVVVHVISIDQCTQTAR